MLINTVVAAFVFALVWAALQNDWLGLYASVEQNLPAGVSP